MGLHFKGNHAKECLIFTSPLLVHDQTAVEV